MALMLNVVPSAVSEKVRAADAGEATVNAISAALAASANLFMVTPKRLAPFRLPLVGC